jgi:phosphate transport system substrate-binding protein
VKFQRYGRLAAAAFAGVLALTACGGGGAGTTGSGSTPGTAATGSSGQQNLSGSVRADGSSTVFPLTEAAAEMFQAEQRGVQVTVAQSGTGGGFKKFCAGETDLSNASRPIKDEEKSACDKARIKYSEFRVANDALTVVVNKDNNWVDCLTVAQLKKIWEPNSKVTTWNQVDPKFPNEKLALFGAGTDSGTFDYFTDAINGEEGASRTDYSPSEDDNVTVQGVAGSKGGLGYFGFSYYEENQDKLKALQIDGGDGCVAPSVEAAQNGTYKPLARPLFIYPKAESLKRPEVKSFVEFYVANHAKIAEEALFIPLNPEQERDLQADLEELQKQAG